MPSGATHAKSSIILASGFGLGALISGNPDLIMCSAGSVVGIFITPDLDLNNKGIVKGSFIKRKLGSAPLYIWKLFWKNYANSLPHGSWVSHFPVFSTYVRIFYILFVGIVPFYILFTLILLSANYHINLIIEALWWCRILFVSWYTVGLASSDLIHWALDNLTTNAS